jgi:hypothetical protein
MNTRNYIIIVFFILVLIIFGVFKGVNINSKKISIDFSELISNESLDDIRLTIIYEAPSSLTPIPWSIDHIINSESDKKIVINGSELGELFDLFEKTKKVDLILVKKKSPYVDVRIYYVLESKENGKLFDVAMWGFDDSLYVNRVEVM